MTRKILKPFYCSPRMQLVMSILTVVWMVVIVGMLVNPAWRTAMFALIGGGSMMGVFLLSVWCHHQTHWITVDPEEKR